MSSQQLEILTDVDGVIANFSQAVLNELEMQGCVRPDGTPFQLNDITQYEIEKALNLPHGTVAKIVISPGFCSSIEPIQEAFPAIRSLRAKGHTVRAITSPWYSKWWVYERTNWLVDRFEFQRRHINHVPDKSPFWGHVLIEDRVESLCAWYAMWSGFGETNPLGILMDRPYNRQKVPVQGICRVYSWQEAVGLIETHEFRKLTR